MKCTITVHELEMNSVWLFAFAGCLTHIGGVPMHKKSWPTGILVRVLEFGLFVCAPSVGTIWTNPALAVCLPIYVFCFLHSAFKPTIGVIEFSTCMSARMRFYAGLSSRP